MRPFPRLSLFLIPALVLAQAGPKPSRQSDKALRERAAQFLQFTMDRTYSKAYNLVSASVRDWYLTSSKAQFSSFKIESVEYSKDRKQATVSSRVMSTLNMNGRVASAETVIKDIWKLEDGKWMWWHDPDILETPFGPIKIDRSKASANPGPPPVPQDTSLNAAADAANRLNVGVSTSKTEVVFEEGKIASDDFSVHNGLPGVLVVNVDIVGDYASFSVEPRHSELKAGQDVTLKVSYKPAANLSSAYVRLTLEPFERTIQIPIKTTLASSH